MQHGIPSSDMVTIHFNPGGYAGGLTAITVWRHQVADTLRRIRQDGGRLVRLSVE